MSNTQVVLASENEIKLAALRRALRKFKPSNGRFVVVGEDIASKVAAQPEGKTETFQGVRNRLLAAMIGAKPACRFVVAIESGIERIGEGTDEHWFDFAIVLVLCFTAGKQAMAVSRPFELPREAVYEARRRGFSTTTVGAVLHEWYSESNPNDPHFYLSRGRVSREDLLVEALKEAFSQVLE